MIWDMWRRNVVQLRVISWFVSPWRSGRTSAVSMVEVRVCAGEDCSDAAAEGQAVDALDESAGFTAGGTKAEGLRGARGAGAKEGRWCEYVGWPRGGAWSAAGPCMRSIAASPAGRACGP